MWYRDKLFYIYINSRAKSGEGCWEIRRYSPHCYLTRQQDCLLTEWSTQARKCLWQGNIKVIHSPATQPRYCITAKRMLGFCPPPKSRNLQVPPLAGKKGWQDVDICASLIPPPPTKEGMGLGPSSTPLNNFFLIVLGKGLNTEWNGNYLDYLIILLLLLNVYWKSQFLVVSNKNFRNLLADYPCIAN